METHQQLLTTLCEALVAQGASDAHIETGKHPIIRIEGMLHELPELPIYTKDQTAGMLTIMAGSVITQKLIEHSEIDFSYDYIGKLRLRGHAYITGGHLAIVLRTIGQVKTLAELGLPEKLAEFARAKQGFFLVVGPVGQGKSSTLAALIDIINTERKEHIVTIENPVEYIHTEKQSLIHQREIGIDTNDFKTGLESVFREDVNVILIGEMRNSETIRTAVTAAETGHLVFSTLHTNSASQTIDRIIDGFDQTEQSQVRMGLASSLLGIISQRLIVTTDNKRIPAYELLINNRAVANLIREGRTHEIDNIIETSSEQGMVSLNQSLIQLVRENKINLDDAKKYSQNPTGLDQLIS